MSSTYPFERFSDQAKQVLTRAQEEAERSHHSYIGTEHLLLGLFQVEGAMASQILAELGVDVGNVRQTIESVLGRNEHIVIHPIIPTARVKKVVRLAFEESCQLRSRWVGSQHLLLGLLLEGEGIAAHVLDDLRVTEGRVREAMGRLSAEGSHETPGPEGPHLPVTPAGRIGAEWQPNPRREKVGAARDNPSTLDDLLAVQMLADLMARFGTTQPPPPALLDLLAKLWQVRNQKQAAIWADDREVAKRHHDEELRLQAEASPLLQAWRRSRPGGA